MQSYYLVRKSKEGKQYDDSGKPMKPFNFKIKKIGDDLT